MRQLSSAFPLSTRDGYHQPSLCQQETAIISLPSVKMRQLSSAFRLSTRDGYHQPSPCQYETTIISLPSVNKGRLSSVLPCQHETNIISLPSFNKRRLSSAFPLSTRDGYHQPSLCQQETAIISLPSVKMRQLSSAFPLSTRDGYHQSYPVNMRQLSSAFPLSTRDGYHQPSLCQNETTIISLPSVDMTSLTKSEPSDDPCQHEIPSDVSIRAQIQISMYAQKLSAAFCLIFVNPFSPIADICNCQLRLSVPSDTQSITITLTIFSTTLIRPAGVCSTEINTLMLMKYAAPTFCVLSFRFSKRSIIYDNSNSICNKHCLLQI